MNKTKKILLILAIIILLVLVAYWVTRPEKAEKQIDLNDGSTSELVNEGHVSPISGLSCDNWNRRPIAVMQPADVPARPAAGFSSADMVIEMPVITATITRLMGIYVCNDPEEVGSMRSARHDFVHLAKGMDAIFVHWGRSDIDWFKEKLNGGVIDDMNCNNDAGQSAEKYCYRKTGMSRGVDSGYAKFSEILQGAEDFGYRMENEFEGYPHQAEASESDRPESGHLRVAFPGSFAVEYDYDKSTNTYLRTWGDEPDTDRNNGERIAPKNVVVLIATSEQIEGQYNNVELGDPWMDTVDNGDAYYYFNGQQYKGTWKKDKSSVDSKLYFYDQSGQEIKFVPGQIWVEVLEPGQGLKWQTGSQEAA